MRLEEGRKERAENIAPLRGSSPIRVLLFYKHPTPPGFSCREFVLAYLGATTAGRHSSEQGWAEGSGSWSLECQKALSLFLSAHSLRRLLLIAFIDARHKISSARSHDPIQKHEVVKK